MEEQWSPIFQYTQTPFQLYDKARSLNEERPWEQLGRFYELEENLPKETMAPWFLLFNSLRVRKTYTTAPIAFLH